MAALGNNCSLLWKSDDSHKTVVGKNSIPSCYSTCCTYSNHNVLQAKFLWCK